MFLIIFRRGTLNLKTSQDAIPPPFDVCWGIVGGHGRVPKTSAVSLLWFWRSTSFSACSRKKLKICEIFTCRSHISATWAATIFSKAARYREWKTGKLSPISKKKLSFKILSTRYTPLIAFDFARFVLSARARPSEAGASGPCPQEERESFKSARLANFLAILACWQIKNGEKSIFNFVRIFHDFML